MLQKFFQIFLHHKYLLYIKLRRKIKMLYILQDKLRVFLLIFLVFDYPFLKHKNTLMFLTKQQINIFN